MSSAAAAVPFECVGIDYGRLKRVRARILAEPEKFSMFDWVSDDGRAADIGGLAAIDAGFITPRSTRHPVTHLLYDVTERGAALDRYVYDQARFGVALNLTPEEADRLYHVERWPAIFATEYALADSPRTRAEVAARRIDFFIKTRGHQ